MAKAPKAVTVLPMTEIRVMGSIVSYMYVDVKLAATFPFVTLGPTAA